MQCGAVLKLINKLRLRRSLRTKNTGAAQLADIICVSATFLVKTFGPVVKSIGLPVGYSISGYVDMRSDGGSISKVGGGPKPMTRFSSLTTRAGSGVARHCKRGEGINSTFFPAFFFSTELI